jgi:hypothetical protein
VITRRKFFLIASSFLSCFLSSYSFFIITTIKPLVHHAVVGQRVLREWSRIKTA